MPTVRSSPTPEARRNKRVALICGALFFGMVGMAYASVPLYKAFCQLTGFDGTIRKAEAAPDQVLDQKLTIRFDANVRDLPWTFTAQQTSQTIKIGQTGLAYFKVTNNGAKAVTGRAVYNVVPESAGAYFQKLECFCFSDQTIKAGETIEFPVVYFVDPEYATDFETKGKGEVTLSYTFFPSVEAGAGQKTAQAPAANHPSALGGSAKAGL
ncbi:cytochrome c oxidase assembly protein [Phenylobacterium sp.]|uniref:cytochrome c oxidase assembly protein n=1 Tax=Phenylobacterium sp. TaxID=1871053 RepID=UPI002737A8B3|nr:cytochrome c oxidase assembly protein [Phenylobacterium sp.]MDP3869982.1 cytochrome c oxidase assembly protein [Phenylobacterium sp.]